MSQDSIRIVVCGDDQVGKSLLVAHFIRERFVPNVQRVIPPITISKNDYAELGPMLEYVPESVTIVDTVASDTLQKELKQADVLLLVYSDHYTYERIGLHWMPHFRSMGVNVPIILCANKCDLIEGSIKSRNAEEFVPLVNEFKEIEACVRCSASTGANVVEAFYLGQRAVTHPIAPLYDSKERTLKPAAVSSLKRVFFLCNKNQNGYLDYQEFNSLHQKCFASTITEDEFDKIKASVSDNVLDEQAFIDLNKSYVESGRHETIWGILRAFHYTNSLSLNDKFVYPKFDVNPNLSVELSPTGYKFLVDLFIKFDKDNDGGLSEHELASLFVPTPGIPRLWQEAQFPSSIVTNEEGYVTLQGWLAQWNLTTFLDHKTTLEYLAYLGYDDGPSTKALKMTKPRKRRQKQGKFYRQSVSDRNVFNCFILGAPNSGKTSLLELFLRGSYSDVYSPTIKPRICAKDIELRGGKQCYLILEELGEQEPAILENKSRLDQCDVICYVYDSSDPESFQYLVDLRAKYLRLLDDVPAVFVALKADLDKQQQRSDVQPENYTRDLFLSSPLHISSAWTSSLHELFIQLVDAAKTPSSATPGLELDQDVDYELVKHYMMAGGVVALMSVVSVWIWRQSRLR